MLFGVDTSGKIGQGTLYISIVEDGKTSVLSELRKKIEKRHLALASRRRIKASNLNQLELKWFIDSLPLNYDSSCLSISTFSKLRKRFMNVKNWKIKILACAVYITSRRIVANDAVILIDRDYSEDVMKNLIKYIGLFFEYFDTNRVVVDVGTSFNEVIALADIVAGCSKRSVMTCREIKYEEIEKLMGIIK